MKIGILMEPLSEARPEINSSLGLAKEALRRGWRVFHFERKSMCLSLGEVLATGHWIESKDIQIPGKPKPALSKLDLTELDLIFLRLDLPPDESFLDATFFLERIENEVTIIIKPSALRNCIDKSMFLRIPEISSPDLTIAYTSVDVMSALERHGEVVVKPLYGYQGRGVVRISSSVPGIAAIVEHLTSQGEALLVQPFMASVREGVVRVTMFGDEVLGAMKFTPSDGEFRPFRGHAESAAELSRDAQRSVDQAAEVLRGQGIQLFGFDLIGSEIVDINILCAGTFQRMSRALNTSIEEKILSRAEKLIQDS